jgi:hypothetical protein
LHEDLHVFLRVEVIGWGLPRLTWLHGYFGYIGYYEYLGDSPATQKTQDFTGAVRNDQGQALAKAKEWLGYAYIFRLVTFPSNLLKNQPHVPAGTGRIDFIPVCKRNVPSQMSVCWCLGVVVHSAFHSETPADT